ncbi:rCG44460 [Rattus norvegicus]|uniref:RCG44460 n=1 Tax=Rattus norvegicus TaxID=10116 RepID=A6I5V1_RAT|nr:rCG44460 [Rattus norvegicus]
MRGDYREDSLVTTAGF